VANNGRAIIKLPFQRRLISFKFDAFIMGLIGELEKQGPWGIVSMILAFLGAAGFFNVNSSTITSYAPNGLSINWLAFGPVLLLLINSIITFVTRRENAKIKRNLNNVKKELDATEKSHEELKQLLKKERSETERLQKELDGLNKICRNDELERLIKPLYFTRFKPRKSN
jgi:Mg2+/Co2+ transporter CorB